MIDNLYIDFTPEAFNNAIGMAREFAEPRLVQRLVAEKNKMFPPTFGPTRFTGGSSCNHRIGVDTPPIDLYHGYIQ